MEYKVVVPKRVQKEITKIDNRYRPRILSALISLRNDPYLGKKLEGKYKNERSYQVWSYRIIYRIKNNELVVLIVRVGHRQGVYKK